MQNNYLQLAWDVSALAKGVEEPGANIKSISNRMFWLGVIPIAVEEIASPALDEDKRSIGKRVLLATVRHIGSGYIGIRDFTNALASGYEPSVGLLGTVSKSLTNFGRDLAKVGAGKTLSKDWITHLATAIGFASGLGGTQVGKTVTGLRNLLNGSEVPRTFDEYRQQLRTGHKKARIHQ
jgi:hypothetical protein